MKRKMFVVLLTSLLAVSVVVGFASCGSLASTCKVCNGSKQCSHCSGTGNKLADGSYVGGKPCRYCNGTGECPACKGSGTMTHDFAK